MASLYLFLLFFSGFFLQTSVLVNLRIYGMIPNILMILVVLVTVYENNNRTLFFSIIFGFLYDLVAKSFFGATMIIFLLVFFVGRYFIGNKGPQTSLAIIASILGFGSVLSVSLSMTYLFLNGGEFSIGLVTIYILQIVLDILVGLLLFAILRRFFELIKTAEERSSRKIIR